MRSPSKEKCHSRNNIYPKAASNLTIENTIIHNSNSNSSNNSEEGSNQQVPGRKNKVTNLFSIENLLSKTENSINLDPKKSDTNGQVSGVDSRVSARALGVKQNGSLSEKLTEKMTNSHNTMKTKVNGHSSPEKPRRSSSRRKSSTTSVENADLKNIKLENNKIDHVDRIPEVTENLINGHADHDTDKTDKANGTENVDSQNTQNSTNSPNPEETAKSPTDTAQPTIKCLYSRDSRFMEQIDNCRGWNSQFGVNRKKRLPFIDTRSTGLVFSSLYKSDIGMKENTEQKEEHTHDDTLNNGITSSSQNSPNNDVDSENGPIHQKKLKSDNSTQPTNESSNNNTQNSSKHPKNHLTNSSDSAYTRPYFKNQFLTSTRRCPGMKPGQVYSYPRVEYQKRPKVMFNPKVPEYLKMDRHFPDPFDNNYPLDNYQNSSQSPHSKSHRSTKNSKHNDSLKNDLLDETSNSSTKERSSRRRASNQITYMEEGLSDEDDLVKSGDDEKEEKDKDFVTWASGYRNADRSKPGSKGRGRRSGGGADGPKSRRSKKNKDKDTGEEKTGLFMIDEDSRDGLGFDSPSEIPQSSTLRVLLTNLIKIHVKENKKVKNRRHLFRKQLVAESDSGMS